MNVHFLYQEIQIEKSKMSHHFWKKLMSHHFYREIKPGIIIKSCNKRGKQTIYREQVVPTWLPQGQLGNGSVRISIYPSLFPPPLISSANIFHYVTVQVAEQNVILKCQRNVPVLPFQTKILAFQNNIFKVKILF